MTPLIHTHDCALYWLGTGTAIKSDEDKLVLWTQTSALRM